MVTTPDDETVPAHARSWIGNLWRKLVVTIEHVVEEAGELVTRVSAFILDTVSAVTQMMTSLFDAIGAAIGEVVTWLAAQFDWEDVFLTSAALRRQLQSTLDSLGAVLPQLEQRILGALNNAKGNVRSILSQMADNLRQQSIRDTVSPFAAPSNQGQQSQIQSNWLISTMLEQPDAISVTVAETPAPLLASINQFFDSIREASLTPASEQAFARARDALEQVQSAQSPAQALNDLISALFAFVEGLADVAIDVLSCVIEGIFALASEAFDAFVSGWLNQPIDIPIVTPLFAEISGGHQLTLMELALLIAAVPVTIVGKLKAAAQSTNAGAARATSLTSSQVAQVESGAVIQIPRALIDLATDYCIWSTRVNGLDDASSAELVLSVIQVVLSGTVAGLIRPGDMTICPFAFWEQPHDFQQTSAQAWILQCVGIGVDVLSLFGVQRLIRAQFRCNGTYVNMAFGLTITALNIATCVLQARSQFSDLEDAMYSFSENLLEALPSICKPLILSDRKAAIAILLAVDGVAPIAASAMRLAKPL